MSSMNTPESSRTDEAYFIISAKLIASSTPGIANAKSCIIEPIIPFESAKGTKNVSKLQIPELWPLHCSTISWIALVGSISIAYRFSKPLTLVASFENFWPKASDRLWAGSVDYNNRGLNCVVQMLIRQGVQSGEQICGIWRVR